MLLFIYSIITIECFYFCILLMTHTHTLSFFQVLHVLPPSSSPLLRHTSYMSLLDIFLEPRLIV